MTADTTNWTHYLPSKRSMVGISGAFVFLIAPILMYNHWISLGKAVIFSVSCVMIIIILRQLVRDICAMERFTLTLHYWQPWNVKEERWQQLTLSWPLPQQAGMERLVKLVFGAGIFLLPIVLGVALNSQLQQFSDVTGITATSLNERVEQLSNSRGGGDLSSLEQTVIANVIDSVRSFASGMVGGLASWLTGVLASYGTWLIALFVILTGFAQATYDKEIKYLRYVVERTIPDEAVERNVFDWAEYFQQTLADFVIGYTQVATLLTLLFFISMCILPLNIGLGAIVLMSFLFGMVTAIPKIGGFAGLGIAIVYMITVPGSGLGWHWLGLHNVLSVQGWILSYDVVWHLPFIGDYRLGHGFDHLIRIVLFGTVAKGMGLFEAYRFTPIIVGERLGATKMPMIFMVVMYAKLDGVVGLTWGIVLFVAHLAFMRLDNHGRAPGQHGWKFGSPEGVDYQTTPRTPSLVS